MRELRQADEAARTTLTEQLLADLGRPATAIDHVACQNLASLVIRADRRERQGFDVSKERQQITQMLRASGLRMGNTTPAPKPFDIGEALAARGYNMPHSASTRTAAPEQPATDTATSESRNGGNGPWRQDRRGADVTGQIERAP